jgi:lipid A 3-O-deacylase
MKAKLLLAFLTLSVCAALAQSTSQTSNASDAARHPGWNIGIWSDYGDGVGTRTDVRFGGAGLRIGRVLTNEHGRGWARGTLEYDIDLTPVESYHFPVYTPRGSNLSFAAKNYYTAGFNPFVAKWNFTRGEKWVPYVAAEGGIVFSNTDMPQDDTSQVNFTSGAAFGFNRFVTSHSAWTLQGKIFHLSNASLGNHNPGVNAALQFKIGFTWFK